MEPLIQIENLRFSYPNPDTPEQDNEVLKGISLTFGRGELVAVLGHNGSGKSTLAKTLNAILLPTSGMVTVAGIDTKDEEKLLEIRQHVGMVFQNPDNQIVATIVEEDVAFGLENLGVPTDEMRVRVDQALHAVGMYEYRTHAPHQLSGGQKQRVAIAGIIAMRPDCIVLDEPTAMLDPQGRKEVMRTIQLLNRDYGITIILITHEMDEAAQCDRVVVVDHGEVVMDDRPEAVFSQVQRMRELGLDVPQATELCDLLRQSGFDLPPDILHADQCIDAIAELFTQKGFVTNAGTGSD
ncbi:MAG: energy-coupling factor transporter ATPase [Oscillospiraceae bacterium]|nr:energy-coupling factor transporter ATPase [Oscillospiraceae bacterium]